MLFRLDYINHKLCGLDTHGIILVERCIKTKKGGAEAPPYF